MTPDLDRLKKSIEALNLNISDNCIEALYFSGFSDVEEVVDAIRQILGGLPGRLNHKFLKCFPEILNQLETAGYFPNHLEDDSDSLLNS